METTAGGALVLAGLTITVVIIAGIMVFSNRETGTAIRESVELIGEQARSAIGDQANTTSTGKRLTVGALNTGITSISAYEHVDMIVEYQSNETGNMVYRRITYVIPAIGLDDFSDHTTSPTLASTLTFSHTVGDFNSRILVVGAQAEATPANEANCTVNSITYNAVPLTEIDEIKLTGGGANYQCVGLWYLLTPDTGTHDVVITWGGNLEDRHGGAISLYNAAQQPPEASAKSSAAPVVTISTSITTVTDGAWVVDAVGSGNPGAGFTTLEPGQTEHYENGADSSSAAGSTKVVAQATTTVMGWSQAANRMAHVVAAFAVADSANITGIPSPNEWVDRSRIPDTLQPEIWDATEILHMRGVLLPRQESDTTGIVTLSTPSGVTATSTFSRPQWLTLASASTTVARGAHLATDGINIYALRGATTTDFWYYNLIDEIDDPQNIWSAITSTPLAVSEGAALEYAEDAGLGYIYALPGGNTTTFWRFDLANGVWDTSTASTPDAVGWGAALEWDNFDTIYALRGNNTDDFWEYTISTDSWALTPGDPADTVDAGGALVHILGDVYAFRGNNTVDFWEFSGGSWGSEDDAPAAVGTGAALAWDQLNYIYAWPGGGSTAFWRFLIPNGPWEVLSTASTPSAVGEGGDLLYLDGDFYGLRGNGETDLWTYQPRGY